MAKVFIFVLDFYKFSTTSKYLFLAIVNNTFYPDQEKALAFIFQINFSIFLFTSKCFCLITIWNTVFWEIYATWVLYLYWILVIP